MIKICCNCKHIQIIEPAQDSIRWTMMYVNGELFEFCSDICKMQHKMKNDLIQVW